MNPRRKTVGWYVCTTFRGIPCPTHCRTVREKPTVTTCCGSNSQNVDSSIARFHVATRLLEIFQLLNRRVPWVHDSVRSTILGATSTCFEPAQTTEKVSHSGAAWTMDTFPAVLGRYRAVHRKSSPPQCVPCRSGAYTTDQERRNGDGISGNGVKRKKRDLGLVTTLRGGHFSQHEAACGAERLCECLWRAQTTSAMFAHAGALSFFASKHARACVARAPRVTPPHALDKPRPPPTVTASWADCKGPTCCCQLASACRPLHVACQAASCGRGPQGSPDLGGRAKEKDARAPRPAQWRPRIDATALGSVSPAARRCTTRPEMPDRSGHTGFASKSRWTTLLQ